MARFAVFAAGFRSGVRGLALLPALWLAACAVEVQNTQPARDLKVAAQLPGSAYAGWRVFQDKCALCHGPAATGTDRAPNLLPLVGGMGSRRFVSLVLRRYDWSFQAPDAAREDAAREALVDAVLQGRQGAITMPAWQGEPSVNAHVLDLYAYLSARSEGTLGRGRPAP
ncbi:MAG TPA: cytochrome c [Burkholderiaceae bacterium]|nr:cytochrome c [Burkholderiaceae bacterium]